MILNKMKYIHFIIKNIKFEGTSNMCSLNVLFLYPTYVVLPLLLVFIHSYKVN